MSSTPLVSIIELEFLERANQFQKSLGNNKQLQLREDVRFDKSFFYSITNRFHFKNEVIEFAAVHPQCPVDLLLEMLYGGELSVETLKYVASNCVQRNPKIVDALLTSEHGSVLESLLTNPALQPECFEVIYKKKQVSEPDYVNALIFRNPNCPREIRMKLIDRCQGVVSSTLTEMQKSQQPNKVAVEFKAIAIVWIQTNTHLFHTFDAELLKVLLDMPGIISPELLLKCTQHTDPIVRLLARKRMNHAGIASKVQISFSDRIRDYFYNEFNLRIGWKTVVFKKRPPGRFFLWFRAY